MDPVIGHWARSFDFIRALDSRWASLSGDVVATGSAGQTVNLTLREGGALANEYPGDSWRRWALLGAGAVVTILLGTAVALLWRRRRARLGRWPDCSPPATVVPVPVSRDAPRHRRGVALFVGLTGLYFAVGYLLVILRPVRRRCRQPCRQCRLCADEPRPAPLCDGLRVNPLPAWWRFQSCCSSGGGPSYAPEAWPG